MSDQTGPQDDHSSTDGSHGRTASRETGSPTRLVSRRRVVRTAVGALGLATAGWSLVGERAPAIARANEESDDPGDSEVTSTDVATVSSDEWLQLHREDRAGQLTRRHGQRYRTSSPASLRALSDSQTQVGTGTPPPTPTATATPAPYETTQDLLFEGTGLEQPLYRIEGRESGPTGLIIGGIHGDEQSGFRAAGQVAQWGVERGTVVVVPAANPPAIERGTRYGRHGDLNRQFPTNADEQPTSRLARGLWSVVRDRDPDWVADLHSSHGIYQSGDGGVGQAVYPTPVDPAVEYATETVTAVNDAFGLDGELAYRRGNVLAGERPMLVHRVGTVLGLPGFILETTEKASLDRQLDWHLYCVDALMHLFGHDPVH